MSGVLQLTGIVLAFQGIRAVDGIDLHVAAGALHGVIGPNGAGKTTVFNVITGLVRPTRGRVLYRGQDITKWPPHRRARAGIARVFQLTQLFRTLTVREHLELTGGTDRAERWIEEWDLGGWLDRRPPELPHGVARHVELMLALSVPSSLLLLDEPAAGLTIQERERLGSALKEFMASGSHTVMLVEHDLTWTLGLVNQLTVLDRGRVIAHGDPLTVAASDAVRAAYLGEEREGFGA